jgi:hypothetical protein
MASFPALPKQRWELRTVRHALTCPLKSTSKLIEGFDDTLSYLKDLRFLSVQRREARPIPVLRGTGQRGLRRRALGRTCVDPSLVHADRLFAAVQFSTVIPSLKLASLLPPETLSWGGDEKRQLSLAASTTFWNTYGKTPPLK